MKRLQGRIVDRYLNTIWAISSSQYVKCFVVGYTSMSAKERANHYLQWGYDHLVILADRLTQAQAHDLEKRLKDECKRGKACGPPYRRKYDPYHRALPYQASAGQGSPNPKAAIHSIYMAWAEE